MLLKDSKGNSYRIISRQGHLTILESYNPDEYIVVRFLTIREGRAIDPGRFGRWYFWDLEKARDLVRYLLKHEKDLINFR